MAHGFGTRSLNPGESGGFIGEGAGEDLGAVIANDINAGGRDAEIRRIEFKQLHARREPWRSIQRSW